MRAQFFGGFLFGVCSSYALKTTPKENDESEAKGAEAPHTLKGKLLCYVDDLLKSVKLEIDATKRIKNVRSMCNEGGFNSTKFTIKVKEILHSIPKNSRRNGVKDKHFGCKLPDE